MCAAAGEVTPGRCAGANGERRFEKTQTTQLEGGLSPKICGSPAAAAAAGALALAGSPAAAVAAAAAAARAGCGQ